MPTPSTISTRKLGKSGRDIPTLGLGLMGLSIAYGPVPPDEERLALLDHAWSLGYTNWDTSDAYGDSEDLIGKWLSLHPERREDIFLASKFGFAGGEVDEKTGQWTIKIDSSAQYARQALGRSLKRLGVDSLDLWYVHRVDGVTPVERTVEVMKMAKEEGKIKAVGLSSVTSRTLLRASAICPIDAVQVEYSPWSVEIEGEAGTNLLRTCRDLGVTVFAYSPLGRGFLTGRYASPDDFSPDDLRRGVPRFSEEHFAANLRVVEKLREMAYQKEQSSERKKVTPAQIALAWLRKQGEDVIPIPGTKSIKYIEENLGSLQVELTDIEEEEVRRLVDDVGVVGAKANVVMASLDELRDTPLAS
ncbi:putative aldo-keto reductase [Zalerion maritima]|uniref:Aldo-keto reductase n=1 Tax=Zalerion maritima TaxID=339359 RepID=A0AAD5RJF3_9PEZI|nr:putative aldo-keto reductase [Zalerion maritima]